MSFKVAYCRYSYTHTTRSHQCGLCKGFGHGQTECGNFEKINTLKLYHTESLDNSQWCKYLYCDNKKYSISRIG